MTSPLTPRLGFLPSVVRAGLASSDGRKCVQCYHNTSIYWLFSSHHSTSISLSAEDASLLDHTHMLRHFSLMLSTVPGGPGCRRTQPCLLRCWNKSPWSLICSPYMRPLQHSPRRDLPVANEGERQCRNATITHSMFIPIHTHRFTLVRS